MQVRLACAAIDWAAFAQEWRSSYHQFTHTQVNRASNEAVIFKTVDDHHHDSLHALLVKYEISGLWTDEEVFVISRVWHFLDGWPDCSLGLQALKDHGFILCTLSNGNRSLLQDLAEFASLPWTHVFSAEDFRAYKPDPSVYLGACKNLDLEPQQCALVAAHLNDLQAAEKCGLQTIYIERENEEFWPAASVAEARRARWIDMWIGLNEKAHGGGILEAAMRLVGRDPA